MEKIRLDIYILKKFNLTSRNYVQKMILNNRVCVNNKIIDKTNYLVNENDDIKIIDNEKYVSRGGYKLEKALKEFNIDLNNKIVLDIGASTGGFSDCCLQNNAKKVFALDVGTNQLSAKLLNNPKIVNIEKTNIKDIDKVKFNSNIDVIVCDVSFISLKYVFSNIKHLININTIIICLIKPQFELNIEILNKTKGKINNPKYHDMAIENVKKYAEENSLKLVKTTTSPILGAKSSNKEFLGLFKLC